MSNLLQDTIKIVHTVIGNLAISLRVTGESFHRWEIFPDGKQWWGSGSATPDTTLYRNAAGALKTDGSLTATAINVSDEAVAASKVSRLPKVAKVALGNTDTAGGVFAFSPGVAALITRILINRTVASTGACTIDVGIAANATTLNDTLIDGLDANATAAVADNINDAGTNGKARQRITSSQYVTGSVASGASAGLVGFAYIEYIEI